MEPYLIVVLVVVVFFVGRLFPTQGFTKKITDVAKENAFRDARIRMHRAIGLCGTYTCLSVDSRHLPLYPRGAETLLSAVLRSNDGGILRISCDQILASHEKVSVRLRNPVDTLPHHSEGFGDILEVVPV